MAEINKDDLFADDLFAPLEELSGSLGDAINQMEKLRNTGKRLEETMDKTNSTVDESVADNKKLADALAKNELLEKKLADAIKKKDNEQRKANAGTKEALDGLSELAPAQAGAVKGFMAMVNAAKAFLLTPIGIAIGVLATAIGALTAYFKGSEAGQNRWNRAMAIAGEIVEKLTDYVEAAGEMIFNTLGPAFEWIGSIAEKIFPNASALVKTFFSDVIAEADRISKLQEDFNEKERELIELRAKTDKEASRLRNKAMEEEGQAKLNLVNQAIALEKQLMDKEIEFGKIKLAIAQKNASDDPTIENKKALAEATAELYTIEKNYYDATKKFNAERIKLEEELTQSKTAYNKAAERTKELGESEIEQAPVVIKGTFDKKAAQEAMAKSVEEANEKSVAYNAKLIEQENEKIRTAREFSDAFGTLASVMKKGTMAQKLFATAQATINTFLGATQVIRDEKLPTLAKFPAVFAIIALGLKQVAAINGVNGFWKGTSNAPEGLAFVGEKGSELIETPSGKLALSPNRTTLAYLEKGTKVYPHEKSMAMLAGTGIDANSGPDMFLLLDQSIKKNGEDIVQAINNSSTRIIEQGSQVYRIMKNKDGNAKYIRLKSLSA